jgi:hypothetical protein
VIDKNLDDLARLVRNRSLFVDQTANINALTARARDDIKELEVGVKALEEYLQQAQSANPQIESQRRAVAQSLRGDLLNATKRFAELLQERTASLRDRNERQRSLYDGLMGSQHLRKRQVGALLLEEEKQPLVEDGPQGASAPPQQQQQRVHEEEDAYLRSRSQAVESIETVLRELAQIMQRLNIMLAQQHEVGGVAGRRVAPASPLTRAALADCHPHRPEHGRHAQQRGRGPQAAAQGLPKRLLQPRAHHQGLRLPHSLCHLLHRLRRLGCCARMRRVG